MACHYGVPYMWGPNFLHVQHRRRQAGAGQLGPGLRGRLDPYAGKVTAYNSPIYIADAALYLKSAQPDLGITDPTSSRRISSTPR